MARYTSLNQNIYFTADPTPVDVDHAAYASRCIVRPKCLLSESYRFFKIKYNYRHLHFLKKVICGPFHVITRKRVPELRCPALVYLSAVDKN